MKEVISSVIDRLHNETGCDHDILMEAFCDAMNNGISIPDFVDSVLDAAVFG